MHLVLDVPVAHPFKTPIRKMNSRVPPICRWTRMLPPSLLAELLHSGSSEKTLLIDSRSFLEYNTSHVVNSVNVGCSKIVKRRLEQNKLSIQELLSTSCKGEAADATCDVIVYDQSTQDVSRLSPDSFVVVLLSKLAETFNSVSMLSGGYNAFKTSFPYLCESQDQTQCTMRGPTLSQPCLPVAKVGPTRVLNYLYVGSQQDVLNEDIMRANGINYVLNVSKTCPSPTHIAPGHFHRIPVRDNYGEKLLPWFEDAMNFIEKVRSANGCVIIHCLAGISRSPTVAIAYIMKHLNMNVDDAYKYVKEKRQSISPNFNFLGQLLEFEKRIHGEKQTSPSLSDSSTTTTTTNSQSTSATKPASLQMQSTADVKSPSTSAATPTVRISKPEAPFPEPILLTEEPRPEPTTPISAETRTYKRSISQQKEGEVAIEVGVQSPKFNRTRTIPRPSGLDVKVSKIGPIFLGSPPLSDSKKPRSGHNSPCGLLDQLAWGTSHLSVNSPEVRLKNPFVEACARLAECRAREEAETSAQNKVPTSQKCQAKVDGKTLTVCEEPVNVPVEPLQSDTRGPAASILQSQKAESHKSAASILQSKNSEMQERASACVPNSSNSRGTVTSATVPKREDQRKCVDVKRLGNSKSDCRVKSKARCKSPRAGSPRPSQTSPKQTHTGKLQVNIKPGKESLQIKTKKVPSPSETSVGFQFGRTRVGKFVDAVLPNTGTKCKTGKAKTKDLPQLMVAKRVHVQLETPSQLSQNTGNKTVSPNDSLNPFFSRQISSQSQSSDNSSGISPSCESESGSLVESSPCSAGISPNSPGQTPNLFDSLGNLVRTPLIEVKSCPTFSTITETESSQSAVSTTEECKTNVWQRRKDCGYSCEEPARPDHTPLERLSGYTSKRSYIIADHTDCERNDMRCNRKTPMVVAGRSASCEEISSCAREAVSEIVVRPRREIIDLSSYGGMDGDEDDYDSRSLSSQRSLSSSCEMIEVS